MITDFEKLLTLKEAAGFLKISVTGLRRFIRRGEITFIKYNQSIFFRMEDLAVFINAYL